MSGTKALAWGEMAYDSKNPRQVVDDYVLIRGDLVDEYAREQLADWIDRYAAARVTEALAPIAALVRSPEADKYRDEACRGVVALPYASNRYLRLLDAVRSALTPEPTP